MKILHVCLSCFYLDDQSYQENELVRCHVDQGHDVLVLASTDTRSMLGEIVYSEPGEYWGSDGARVIRLRYRWFLSQRVASKIRAHPGVYKIIADFKPDAILFHGACGYEIITVARYVRDHPEVIFYIDSHEDWNNSARSFLSREVLHKMFYRYCLGRAWPVARKVLAISTETMTFINEVYGVPVDKIEFFPLGGNIRSDDDYAEARGRVRAGLGVGPDETVFMQMGKQTRAKKLIESLKAFSGATKAKMFIAGSIDAEIEAEATGLIAANPNIAFLGWQSAQSVGEFLCAADVYLQPGTQSVTMQNSLCCRCVPIIADVPSHQVYVDGNGWLIRDADELSAAIQSACVADLNGMSMKSLAIARRLLDYGVLSQRVLR